MRHAVDQHRRLGRRAPRAAASARGASTVRQAAPRRGAVVRDARAHLVVAGLGGGDVAPRSAGRELAEARFGEAALARARAAGDEDAGGALTDAPPTPPPPT